MMIRQNSSVLQEHVHALKLNEPSAAAEHVSKHVNMLTVTGVNDAPAMVNVSSVGHPGEKSTKTHKTSSTGVQTI